MARYDVAVIGLGRFGSALALRLVEEGREVLGVDEVHAHADFFALGGSSLSAVGIISTVGLSMFPFILPSSVNPQSSLTVWNASSSHLTLFIMLLCTVVFLPLILIYTAWVYRVLWGRTSTAALKTNPDLY